MKCFIKNHKGFTIIELLFVIVILSIFYGISIQTFKTYKESAYNAVVDQTIRDASQAIDIGKMDLDEISNGETFNVFVSQEGILQGDKQILPAYVASKNTNVFVTVNLSCKVDYAPISCISKWISAFHCRGGKQKILTIFNNGEEQYKILEGGASCS